MAWLYGMAIECESHDSGHAVERHFDGFDAQLGSGQRSAFTVELDEEDSSWWVSVINDDFRSGEYPAIADDLTHLRDALYARLRTAPPFRFALVGVEVFAAFSYETLVDQLADPDGASPPEAGLVVADDVVAGTPAAPSFTRFADGYRWIEP